MPSIANRALLLNLGLFTADNNIRRNTGTFTHNFQCGENEIDVLSRKVSPGGNSTPDISLTKTIIDAGSPTTNAIFSLTVSATAGSYLTEWGPGGVIGPIAYNATASQVQAAIDAAFGPGAMTVTGGPGDATGSTPYVFTTLNPGTLEANYPSFYLTGTGVGTVVFQNVAPDTLSLTVAAQAGSYRLTMGPGNTTAQIPFNASALALEQAINTGMPSLPQPVVTVTGGPGDATGSTPYTLALNPGLGLPLGVFPGRDNTQLSTLAAGDSWTVTSGNVQNNFMLIETTGQIQAEVTLGVVPAATNKAARTTPVTFTQIVNQVAVFDDNVQSVSITNPGIEPVRVTVVQG